MRGSCKTGIEHNRLHIPMEQCYHKWLAAAGRWHFTLIMWQVLRKPGRAVLLAVGGAEEALLARPGTNDLILNKRRARASLLLRALHACSSPPAAHSALYLHVLFMPHGARCMLPLCSSAASQALL